MNNPVNPTVGRIVHYQSYGTPGGEFQPQPRAAIITDTYFHEKADLTPTECENGCIGLAVLNPTGMYFNAKVPFSAEPKPGHWNWPPRT